MKTKLKHSASQSPQPAPVTPDTAISTSAIAWFAQSAIILALIPFIGYWCTLAFEQGFLSYFSIPYYFVSLNTTIILSTSIVLPALGIALLALICPVIMFIHEAMNTKIDIKFCLLYIPITLALIILIYMTNNLMKSWIIIFTGFVAYLPLFLSFLSYKYNVKGIQLNFIWVFLVIFAFLGILTPGFNLFHEGGKETAKTQKEFPVLVLSSLPSKVAVIRSYGDYLYAVPFNPDTNKFEKKLVIVKISELTTIPLAFETVGPLQPLAP
jgi:hypothetical protein